LAERVYCSRIPESGRVTLGKDEAHHLVRVRRAEPGFTVEVFDGLSGFARLAQIVSITGECVVVELVGAAIPEAAAPVALTLITAVPKGDRFDWLVEKAVEVGVAKLVPLISRRSVVEPRLTKLERLKRRVIEASKQCGRNRLMAIDPPADWAGLVESPAGAVRLLADPRGVAFRRWPEAGAGSSFALAIGPEGGFEEGELESALSAGWVPVSLGAYVLRVETAAVVGASLVMSRYGGHSS
jgi:16S rRNA (uracil1498-N3)-methyltransferase